MERSLSATRIGRSKWDSAVVPGAVLAAALLFAGCSSSPGSGQPASGDAGSPAASAQTTPAVTEAPAPAVAGPSVQAVTPEKTSAPPAPKATRLAPGERSPQASVPPIEPAPPAVATPQPTARESTPTGQPAATRAAPAPAKSLAPIAVDIGGQVDVGATKPGLTRIGSDKCKLCHKVQFASWAETRHAARTPPLDCESCHGPGSEYKSLAIMKDAKKARAAGLVIPERSFCATCHTTGWSDDLLKKAHAHKAG